MRFPQNPEMETLTFEAALFIGGDNEFDAHIRYTPGFQMNHAELADILHDAYYDGKRERGGVRRVGRSEA